MAAGDDDRDNDPMNPEAWYAEPNVCGSCIAWRPGEPRPGEDVAAGTCRLRAELNRVPATLRKCDLYKPRGQFVYQAPKSPKSPKRRKRASTVRVLKRSEAGELVPAAPPPRASRSSEVVRDRPPVPRSVEVGTDDASLLRAALEDAVKADFPVSGRDMMGRFEGGRVKVTAPDGAEVKLSAERFFELLERFRVSLEGLEDALARSDPLLPQLPELQKTLKQVQGTFTSFNFLYADRSDYFSGK